MKNVQDKLQNRMIRRKYRNSQISAKKKRFDFPVKYNFTPLSIPNNCI